MITQTRCAKCGIPKTHHDMDPCGAHHPFDPAIPASRVQALRDRYKELRGLGAYVAGSAAEALVDEIVAELDALLRDERVEP